MTLTSQLRFSQYINSSWITPVSDFTSLLKTASGKAFLQTSHEIFLPCVSFSSLTGESWSFGGAERRCRLRNLGGNIGRTHDVITAGQRHTNAWLISSFSVELRYRVRYNADLPVSTAVYAFLCSPRDFFQYPSICWQLCARVLFMIRKYLLNQSMAPHNVYCLVYLLMTHVFTLSFQEWFSFSGSDHVNLWPFRKLFVVVVVVSIIVIWIERRLQKLSIQINEIFTHWR